jgi:endonuclease G
MARAVKKSSGATLVSLAKLNPKKLIIAFAGVATCGLSLFTWHHFADDVTKGKIETGTLAVVDVLRENRITPPELVFWLDLVADGMPMVRGRGVSVTTADLGGEKFTPGGAPLCERQLTPLRNTGYVVGYDERRKNPAWVSYKVMTPRFDMTPRPSSFEPDNRTSARIRTTAYSHSGYDRGHMAPNNAINLCYGTEAQRETFRMSNITPQLHALNDGLWRAMEQRVLRRYPRRFKEVWVTCGPVFENPDRVQKIREGVWVPDAFFMIVTDRDEDTGELRAQAYLVPQRDISENEDPSDFLTPIRTIETKTGLNFFPNLPTKSQESLETPKALKAW